MERSQGVRETRAGWTLVTLRRRSLLELAAEGEEGLWEMGVGSGELHVVQMRHHDRNHRLRVHQCHSCILQMAYCSSVCTELLRHLEGTGIAKAQNCLSRAAPGQAG